MSQPLTKDACVTAARKFRSSNGIEATDENIIATMHLMNTHGLDRHAALDQSSRSGNDRGIDAWYYDSSDKELVIYQSKLTDSRPLASKGFSELMQARQWLESVLVGGEVEAVPSDNHSLFNLYTTAGKFRDSVERIRFSLISPFGKSELDDSDDYRELESDLAKSALNTLVHRRRGALIVDAMPFNLASTVPHAIKAYAITKIDDSRVTLSTRAYLDLAYVSLYSLVQLYRQRGEVLFDKNVRLSLMGTKEARERLVSPMEKTFDRILAGVESATIFPFYHVGVTIAAASSVDGQESSLRLEAPSIINGCQTISIANEYVRRLEKQSKTAEIERFKEIQVIAKIVVGTSSDQVREITNSNNRQNPIENWQLFSNEPIHIEIETALKERGVFYERQKGKFDAVMKNVERAQQYQNTNATYIKVVELGQVVALSKAELQLAAKPSEIFLNKENHEKIFDRSVAAYPRDIVFASNSFKALKRALNTYLEKPRYNDDAHASKVFVKPIVRAHIYQIALKYGYEQALRWDVWREFSTMLNKKAAATLTSRFEGMYQKFIARTKTWYVDQSHGLEREVSNRALRSFFDTIATDLGISLEEGPTPFGAASLERQSMGEHGAKPSRSRENITEVQI
jgi:hypothetical protein